MLADSKDVEPDLIRELDLLHEIEHSFLSGNDLPGFRVRRRFRECVNAEFHLS
jgi:hypothetical protein